MSIESSFSFSFFWWKTHTGAGKYHISAIVNYILVNS